MELLKCILVDDELPGLAYLRMLCEQLPDVEIVKAYNNPVKLLEDMDRLDFNTCILDIAMPGINGLQLAKQLHGKAIIFSTAYKDYAVEAFDLEAVDYIRKPYQPDRLEKALAKARRWIEQATTTDDGYAELNSNKGKTLLHFREIALVTVADHDRRDKTVILKNNREILLKNITFDRLVELLPAGKFCQINRKTLIALDCVSTYTQQWVISSLAAPDGNPLQFQLSAPYREAFKAQCTR